MRGRTGGEPVLQANLPGLRRRSDASLAKIPVPTPMAGMRPCNGMKMNLVRAIAAHCELGFSPFSILLFSGLLVVAACGRAPLAGTDAAVGEWHEFEGTWTAAGSRYIMRLGNDRQASIANFNGSLLLAGHSRPAIGFRAEAIVLNDSVTGVVGRAVWTDERGDQAYSELRGEGSATSNRIVGTFLGGTGRYSGAEGTYEFSWRFVLENEDGTVQGQSIGLKGRVRVPAPQGAVKVGGPEP